MATAQSRLHRKDNVFTEENISKNAFKFLMLACLAYILMTNNLTIGIGEQARSDNVSVSKASVEKKPQKVKTAKASLASFHKEEKKELSKAEVKNLANQFHNVAFLLDPNLASYKNIPQEVVDEKMKICADYVKKYAPIAKLEEQKMGIPASITLAQGLLESDAGGSRLTKSASNHFGIKCFSKHCKKGHCKNFTDDTHKDFFIVYQSAWQSFRSHSDFLKKGSRYSPLFRLRKSDYKAWANGLKSAGYATDKKYNEKLIRIIETLHLNELR
jgi:flagellum-specific peptidoglycan hydrolase FlgJ